MAKVRESNLYRNGIIYEFKDGSKMLRRELRELPKGINDTNYTVRETDTLPKIAYEFYKGKVGNAWEYWHLIADVNNIHNPLDLSELVGTTITIPDILRAKLYL